MTNGQLHLLAFYVILVACGGALVWEGVRDLFQRRKRQRGIAEAWERERRKMEARKKF